MKTWLFAILEAGIAVAGLGAYFWGDNVVLAGAAALLAAVLGIAQPLMAARAARRMERYQDEMFDSSVDAVNDQIDQLQSDVIDVPAPHQPTVQAILARRFGDESDALLAQYERVVKAIQSKSFAAEELAAALADKLDNHPLTIHLRGMAALSQENYVDALEHFTQATHERSAWVSPWLGWAASAWRLNQTEEITQRHPHVNNVELTPYDVGDEQTFIDLSEGDRDALVEQFQATARALGNFYTMAEFSKSKAQIEASRQRLRRAA